MSEDQRLARYVEAIDEALRPTTLLGFQRESVARSVAAVSDVEQAELRSALVAVERFAQAQAVTARARGAETERDWLDVLALLEPRNAASRG